MKNNSKEFLIVIGTYVFICALGIFFKVSSSVVVIISIMITSILNIYMRLKNEIKINRKLLIYIINNNKRRKK